MHGQQLGVSSSVLQGNGNNNDGRPTRLTMSTRTTGGRIFTPRGRPASRLFVDLLVDLLVDYL